MLLDDPYMSRPRLAAARQLQRVGQWDLAVDMLAAEPPDPTTAALRAEILVDRHWWCLDRAAEAQQAVTGLTEDHSNSALAALLDAQLRYTRAMFGTQFGLDPGPDDALLAEQAFRQATDDARLRSSLYLRAALGARPHVASAQATLADALPAGAERDVLRDTATRLAGDLGLSWLLAMLRGDPT